MLLIPFLSIVCALSTVYTLPLSVVPVRPYIFLAPELPKYQLQPSLKVQSVSPTVAKCVLLANFIILKIFLNKFFSRFFRSDLAAAKQYVLVYPTYQYYVTRQDGSSSSPVGGFFENLQNYFVNFGGQNEIMDAIEPEKPIAQPITESPIAPMDPPSIVTKTFISDEKPAAEKEKVFVSQYLTPASTVPLNADRRLYYLSQQPQIYGQFNGPPLNPVFNLQPLPLVVSSRSNVAQVADEPNPNKVITENVQQFSQIQPVVANVEPVVGVQPQVKSIFSEQVGSVVVGGESAENRVAPVIVDNRAIPIPTTEATVAVEEARPAAVFTEARSSSEIVQPVVPVVPPVVDVVVTPAPQISDVVPSVLRSSDVVAPIVPQEAVVPQIAESGSVVQLIGDVVAPVQSPVEAVQQLKSDVPVSLTVESSTEHVVSGAVVA